MRSFRKWVRSRSRSRTQPGGSVASIASRNRSMTAGSPRYSEFCQSRSETNGSTAAMYAPPYGRPRVIIQHRLPAQQADATGPPLNTGERVAALDGRSAWPPRVAFSADGRALIAVGSDNHVRVWDMEDSAK